MFQLTITHKLTTATVTKCRRTCGVKGEYGGDGVIELINGGWLLGELGVFNLPANVKRCNRSAMWKVYSEANTFWEFKDIDSGSHYLSLKKAIQFAVTIGSLSYQDTIECLELTRKFRLAETGVLGVYHRRGLHEAYWVAYGGNLIKVDYEKGKGFMKAVRTLEELKVPSVEKFLSQFTRELVC